MCRKQLELGDRPITLSVARAARMSPNAGRRYIHYRKIASPLERSPGDPPENGTFLAPDNAQSDLPGDPSGTAGCRVVSPGGGRPEMPVTRTMALSGRGWTAAPARRAASRWGCACGAVRLGADEGGEGSAPARSGPPYGGSASPGGSSSISGAADGTTRWKSLSRRSAGPVASTVVSRRGGGGGVAEQLLHGGQIGAGVEQVAGVGAAKVVRGRPLRNIGTKSHAKDGSAPRG